MSTVTAWRTDEPCPVCATGLILHDDGTSPAWAECRLCGWSDTWTGDQPTTEVTSDRTATGKTTRAQRMAMPLARQVVEDLAVEHGACIRPIQLRRTNLDTGEADTVLVPCGHTLAHVCPSCAERARTLRAAQCREGWHLEDEPDIAPDPATEDQRWWVEKRAEAQQLRDQAEAAGQDTADFDELITELDEEITKAGIRGKAAPERPARRHRSTRRRQDAPDLPCRKVSPRTVGKTYTAPDGKTFRPVPVRHADLSRPTAGSARTAHPPTPARTSMTGRRGTR